MDILDELENAKTANAKLGRIIPLEQDLRSVAETARERIINYAIRYLDAGSYDTISDVLEPASSILDRSDVKALVNPPEPQGELVYTEA